ncbi:MAG TPA: GDP-mannose 4,6-dehydratase [Candidatus Woesebacteria bacterium]|nr:GDP-mannose 4,6-dehydratase [Candidatus Woesebacteria bacterium]
MKKVLITGSEGFVGGHLWKELESNGYEVYGTTFQAPETELPKNVSVCDIENLEQISSLISKINPDAIFHLAGWSNPGSSFTNPQKTFAVNSIGTINLLESVRKIEDYHPRIVAIGSSAEFGAVPSEMLPITENTPLNPNSPYGVSKVSAWYICKQFVVSYKMDIVYATPFNHTGPGQLPGFLAPDIASQVAKIEKGNSEPVILTGDLSTKRDMLDVRDVVRAYRLILEKGITGERYLISSGKSGLVSRIVDILLSKSSAKITRKIDPAKMRPSDIPDQYGDSSKLNKLTGWKPEIPLEKTLQDLLDWYREKR